jgi:hypothetical protein
MPVNYVSFYDALRFANWLHNGQPTGAQGNATTEGGAYTIMPDGIAANSFPNGPPRFGFVPASMLCCDGARLRARGRPRAGSTQKRFSRIAASVRSASTCGSTPSEAALRPSRSRPRCGASARRSSRDSGRTGN